MFVVITGGSGSGKSEYAENRACELRDGPMYYIATMIPWDEECKQKIVRHREQRSQKGFETIECYKELGCIELQKDSTVLLECMSNLVANEFFDKSIGKEKVKESIINGIQYILQRCKHLVIVTNEVCSDGIVYDNETTDYQIQLGNINQALGELADEVIEVVYSIPVFVKRERSNITRKDNWKVN